MQERARSRAVASEQRCIVVDWRCRESEGKVKIEGYMSVSDEEAHHRFVFWSLRVSSACLTNAYSKGLDPVQTAFTIKQFKSHYKVGTPAKIKQLLLECELLLAEQAVRR